MPSLSPLDRISSLRDEFPYRPYAGGAAPYPRRDYEPAVEDFVSAARSASQAQPVYATRAGYQNFDRFDDRPPQRKSDSGPRTRSQRQPQSAPQPQRVLRSSNNKDLKDTSPKKVLKRPATQSSQKAPNQQSLSDQLKQMGSDEPVIGLKHVTEFPNSGNGSFSYKCSLCEVSGNASKMADHIASKVHRRNYIKEHKLEEVADKDLAKRAAAIETVHGRGEWTVAPEEQGFVRLDKSKFFKKVKKNQDVEMQDVTEPKSSSGLAKGDVVVDELVIGDDDDDDEPDPESNPKFFVLKQIDKLLDDDFIISNESEAMVVDSIIRKMDRSLAQFVEMANAESGIDDIQLLDKDDNVVMTEQPAKADAESVAAAAASAAAVPSEKAAEVVTDVLVDVPTSEPAVAAAVAAEKVAE